jgi:hypothetical protein
MVIIDAVRERRPPFSPEDCVAEFADLLRSYKISAVQGDRYGGEWPRERFKVHGVSYEPAAKSKSDLYRDLLPLLNARRIDLLDVPRLTSQLAALERRVARGGRDSIDHAPGLSHDDVANCVAGVAAMATDRAVFNLENYVRMDWVCGPDRGATAQPGLAEARDRARALRTWKSPYWQG